MAKKYYELQGGGVFTDAGKVYESGAVVQSDKPLMGLFPGKFKEVPPPQSVQPQNPKPYLKYSKEAKKAHAMTGLEPGEEAQPDMETREEAFEEMGCGEDEANPLGRNVTDKFPKAEECGLMVFKSKKGYFAAEKGSPHEALHDEGFTSPAKVNKFIKEHSS